jgi:hypothetical protein
VTRKRDPDQSALLPVGCERCGRSGTYYAALKFHGATPSGAAARHILCMDCYGEIGLGQLLSRWQVRRLRL